METASNGTYSLGGLASGSYRVEFRDGSGTYAPQYYNNETNLTSATAIAVTAPKTTANINATSVTAGHVSGTVKNASGSGLGDIESTPTKPTVSAAFRPRRPSPAPTVLHNKRVVLTLTASDKHSRSSWSYVNEVETASNGSYDLDGLASGSYRLEFRDSSGSTRPSTTTTSRSRRGDRQVAVTAGKTTADTNATLAAAPGHIRRHGRKWRRRGLAISTSLRTSPTASAARLRQGACGNRHDGWYNLGAWTAAATPRVPR